MEPYEKDYCGEICSFLEAEVRRLREESAALKREMREAGKRMAEEDPYAGLYQNIDSEVSGMGRHIMEMERRVERAGKNDLEAGFLEKLRLSPYFGRVNFSGEDAGEDAEAERYYIGLRTLMRHEDARILTYDWRAPVSALFYTGEVGKASYQAPGGVVSGEISRIRQHP